MFKKHSFLSLSLSQSSLSDTHFAVFNVTDCDGNKIRDEGFLNYIQKVSDYNNIIRHFPSFHLVGISQVLLFEDYLYYDMLNL